MEEAQIVKVKLEVSDEPIREEQSIKLGLGIGGGDSSESGSKLRSNKKRKKKSTSVFSVDQLKELEQQRLIFNYLAAGLPVPFYLVLPYWKSTVTTFGGSNPDFYKQFPSFVRFGGFEPGRCRRTDGKKWRCSRDVVPDENYCEKHIHRGRNRSRKPVETSEVTSPSTTKLQKNSEGEVLNSTTNHQNSTPPSSAKLQKNSEGEVLNSTTNHQNSTPPSSAKLLKNSEGEALNSNTNHQSSTHKGLQLMAQSSNIVTVCHGPTTFSSSYHEFEKNISRVTVEYPTNAPSNRTATASNVAVTASNVAVTATTAERVNAITSTCNENNLLLGVKYNSSSHPDSYGIIRGSRNNTNLSNNISQLGSGFSPKSVLQGRHMILVGCNSLYSKNGSSTDIEPGRCRRTDGKKWRCKRDVLPDQKYCDRHIHRGVKQLRSSRSATSTSAAAMNNAQPSQTTTVAKEIDCAIPNTNLTMSIPARSLLIQNVEKSNSSCDSDATVTDTSLAAYEQPI